MVRTFSHSALIALLAAGIAVAVPAEAASPSTGGVITVESSAVGSTTTLGGAVVPFKEVTLAAQMPGRVEYIAGVEGDWFKERQVLVALDDDDLLAQRRSAAAAYSQAQANWRNARVQYSQQVYGGQDAPTMTGMGMPTLMDKFITKPMADVSGTYDPELQRRAQIFNRGTAIDQARSGIIQAQARLEEINARLRDTQSVAPFSGVIMKKFIEVGDTVQPGMPLLAFADTRHLQIKVDIPARLMPGIKKGMIIPAKLDVGNTYTETRVAQIYPSADPQRHTVTVKLDMPSDAPGGPGMYAEVMVPDITTPVKGLPTIPKSAVFKPGSLDSVYVLNNKGEAELRSVRVGAAVDDHNVSILSGLRAGERILADPDSRPRKKKSEKDD